MLLNGAKISYITVGGRTTAVVASVQKKTDVSAGPEEVGEEPEKAVEGDPDAEDTAKTKKSRVTKSAPGKKSKSSKEHPETTTLTQAPKGKSLAVEQDQATTPGVIDKEGKNATTEKIPETTTTTSAKKPYRKGRALKDEAGPPIPIPTDSKIATNGASTEPTSVAVKKRKAKTEAPDPGPTTAGAPSKKQKLTPSRSAIDYPADPAVSTEPVKAPQARKRTKATKKDGKSGTTSIEAVTAGAAAGEEEFWGTRRRSRRVSGRDPVGF